MPYKEVWVDEDDLDNFDDDDLIEELESRGYLVEKNGYKSVDADVRDVRDVRDVMWHFKNGRKKDALILLERIYPELYGLSKLI
jgi:hypothetical protein